MANYADNAFYTDTYLAGKEAVIDAASFNFYARQATQSIKLQTFYRIPDSNIPEEVKMCCCEVAELAYIRDKSKNNKNVASEKVGSYSTEYKTSEQAEKEYADAAGNAISKWLAMTGLLYRGVC